MKITNGKVLPILSIPMLFAGCGVKNTEETTGIKQTNITKPNIIIILADDMGYGDLTCYGHPNIRTDNIDKMANEGIRFTSFYVGASVCTPSRASLLTGRFPIRHTPNNFGPESKDGMPLNEITLANILKEQGYTSMAIGKWHLGHQEQYLPTSRGFDSFYGLPYSNDMIVPWCPWLSEEDTLFLYKNTQKVKEIGYHQESLTEDYTKEAIKFINTNREKPFFLYLGHSMPHLPVSTSENFKGKSTGGYYGDVIETIDWSVGEILKTLKELGLDENTIVAFTSDNGPWQNPPERMLQKGVEPWHVGFTGGLHGAKGSTYEGGYRVPGIIRWPGIIPAHQVNNQMVSTMDLFATFVTLAGGKLHENVDGFDVFPLLKGEANSPRQKYFYTQGTKIQAVRIGDFKLRQTSEGTELYNLTNDPCERINIASRYPEKVRELTSELTSFAKETGGELVMTKND